MWNLTLYTAIIIIVSLIGSFAAVIFVISLAKLILLLCMKLMPHYFLNITKDTRNCRQNSDVGVSDINDFRESINGFIPNWPAYLGSFQGILLTLPRYNIIQVPTAIKNTVIEMLKIFCQEILRFMFPILP